MNGSLLRVGSMSSKVQIPQFLSVSTLINLAIHLPTPASRSCAAFHPCATDYNCPVHSGLGEGGLGRSQHFELGLPGASILSYPMGKVKIKNLFN